MNNNEPTGLGRELIATTERLSQLLGFHDLTSLFVSLAFVLLALMFVASCAVFLVKKHRERRRELLRVVHEVQAEFLQQSKETAEPKTKPEPVVARTPI